VDILLGFALVLGVAWQSLILACEGAGAVEEGGSSSRTDVFRVGGESFSVAHRLPAKPPWPDVGVAPTSGTERRKHDEAYPDAGVIPCWPIRGRSCPGEGDLPRPT